MAVSTTQPVPLGLEPSFGFGDRLGLATSGHLDALRAAGGPIRGIFAQQSIREMNRTDRTPQQVMNAAVETLQAEGFNEPWSADADHLKTPQDVDQTAEAGFIFYTIDPSDHVDTQADDYDLSALDQQFALIQQATPWVGQYSGKKISIPDGPTIDFDVHTVQRAAVKYGAAIAKAIELAEHIKIASTNRGQPSEIELSVDETPQPTTLAEHYIIADQCRQAGINLVSLAPRYVGDFEKAVDYKGDLHQFEASLSDHAAIARHLGPYKLSLHSGSDKLSIYSILARVTRGMFHVKTAGTSYLEALRVAARSDEALLRKIIDYARDRYDQDRATYHVSATVENLPKSAEIADGAKLEQLYLECWPDVAPGTGFTQPGRQIVHCTFGSVLRHPQLGPAIKQLVAGHPDLHRQILADHFVKHLEALRAGLGH